MDDIVHQALKKWPDVPDCRGWLALDARGDWYLRDAQAQAAAAFPQVKGSRIDHAALREFIGRNYQADERGGWFFQNGPQRVYVLLEAAPWVWRLQRAGVGTSDGLTLTTHTGVAGTGPQASFVDEHGRVFVATPLGLGLVHTLDMHLAADAVEAGAWQPEAVAFDELPKRFGYLLQP